MKGFKMNQKVLIKELGKKGIIIELDKKGNPTKVFTGSEVIDVIDKTVLVIKLLKWVWLELKKIFK